MKFEYSIGNRKLGRDTLIFNMTSATDCPSRARGLCKHPARCYALKAERLYKAVLPYRRRQAAFWAGSTAPAIGAAIGAALRRHPGVKYVRVNESGDLRNQRDVSKLYRVANIVGNWFPGAVLYLYTARRDLNFAPRPDNLVVNGSGFMIDNSYTAVEAYTSGALRCSAKVCPRCTLCKTARGREIENLLH